MYGVAGACLVAAIYALPASASAAVTASPGSVTGTSPASMSAGPSSVRPASASAVSPRPQPQGGCPRPASLQLEQCQSITVPHGKKAPGAETPASAVGAPLTAAQLENAYGITGDLATGGSGETVAIVDAYRDPTIVSDLAAYRSANSLPACDSSTGAGCLTVYDQNGAVINPADSSLTYPPAPPDTSANDEMGWENETALDTEMVSAICPQCKIALFEANSPYLQDLGTAENSAAKIAKFVSNSWSNADYVGESAYDNKYFNHPGVAVVFASGDYGYGASYPASSQYVTSVGGTYLDEASASGPWTQVVWGQQGPASAGAATAAGCSSGEPEPSWEQDAGGSIDSSACDNRIQNDVSAVASAAYGIGIYSSMTDALSSAGSCGGSCAEIGTSVATPIITAMYALAGNPAPNTYPASYPYQHAQDLTHITSGTDIVPGGPVCESNRQFLCNAADSLSGFNGYNGPAGLGTPNGNLLPFKEADSNFVSVPNPGDFDFQAGESVRLPSLGSKTEQSGTTLTYSASGLPSGLTLSGDIISGTLSGTPTGPAGDRVAVTVTGTKSGYPTATSMITFRITTTKSLTTGFHPVPSYVVSGVSSSTDYLCLDDDRNGTANGNKVDIYTCNGGPSQNWEFVPGTQPGAPGTLRINGKCAAIEGNSTTRGALIDLYTCDNAAGEQWVITGYNGELSNPHSGDCLNVPNGTTTPSTQLNIGTCSDTSAPRWSLPPSPVQSGIAGMCVNDASSAAGSPISLSSCSGSGTQKFYTGWDGNYTLLTIHNGECLDVKNNASTNGSPVVLEPCQNTVTVGELWELNPDGVIENAFSQECLADPSNRTTNGTQLVIATCYGQAGEVWADS